MYIRQQSTFGKMPPAVTRMSRSPFVPLMLVLARRPAPYPFRYVISHWKQILMSLKVRCERIMDPLLAIWITSRCFPAMRVAAPTLKPIALSCCSDKRKIGGKDAFLVLISSRYGLIVAGWLDSCYVVNESLLIGLATQYSSYLKLLWHELLIYKIDNSMNWLNIMS